MKIQSLRKVAFIALLLLLAAPAVAQRVAFKTNGLYLLTGTVNAGIEARMSDKITFDMEFMGNPIKFGKVQDKFVSFQPEVRYWLSGRTLVRHFVGVMGAASIYDFRMKDKAYDGKAVGAGVTYGYDLVLTRKLNIEFTVGAGAMYMHGRKASYAVDPATNPDGRRLDTGATHKWLPMPMKLGVNIVYLFR